jgi:hypothetical protein
MNKAQKAVWILYLAVLAFCGFLALMSVSSRGIESDFWSALVLLAVSSIAAPVLHGVLRAPK